MQHKPEDKPYKVGMLVAYLTCQVVLQYAEIFGFAFCNGTVHSPHRKPGNDCIGMHSSGPGNLIFLG